MIAFTYAISALTVTVNNSALLRWNVAKNSYCSLSVCSHSRRGNNCMMTGVFNHLPSNRHHLSCADYLKDESEACPNCCVLYCVTITSTHMWAVGSYHYAVYVQLQKLGHLLRVGGCSTTEMHGQIMQLVARAAVKVRVFHYGECLGKFKLVVFFEICAKREKHDAFLCNTCAVCCLMTFLFRFYIVCDICNTLVMFSNCKRWTLWTYELMNLLLWLLLTTITVTTTMVRLLLLLLLMLLIVLILPTIVFELRSILKSWTGLLGEEDWVEKLWTVSNIRMMLIGFSIVCHCMTMMTDGTMQTGLLRKTWWEDISD